MTEVTAEQKARAGAMADALDLISSQTARAGAEMVRQGVATATQVDHAAVLPAEAAKLLRELAGI